MIYIMRHGQTDENKLKRRQGWENSSLNAQGRKQAVMAKRWIEQNLHVDHIFCSDLERASQTAYILDLGCPIEKSMHLRERNWGEESLSDVSTRVEWILKHIVECEGNVLVVTHGNTARHLISQLSCCPIAEVTPFDNCEIRWATAMETDLFGQSHCSNWQSHHV